MSLLQANVGQIRSHVMDQQIRIQRNGFVIQSLDGARAGLHFWRMTHGAIQFRKETLAPLDEHLVLTVCENLDSPTANNASTMAN